MLVITSIFLTALSSISHAEDYLSSSSTMKFDHISVAKGLSSGDVFSIVQDNDGYIWIGTFEGLNKYDGTNITKYRYKSTDANSIAHNLIRKLFIDSNKNLWIGTEKGLSLYNPVTDNFKTYRNEPNKNDSLLDNVILDIYEDHRGTLFVSSDKGVQKFDPSTQSFKKVKIRGYEDKISEIKTIAQDSNNNYWLGSFGNGIYLTNKSFNKAENLKFNDTKSSTWPLALNANTLFDFKVINGNFWLATDNGVYIISEQYIVQEHINTFTTKNILLSNEVRAINQVSEGNVWLATRKGLNSIDIATKSVSTVASPNEETANFSEYWLTTMLKDDSGQIWVGTYGQGVYMHNPASNIFRNGLNNASLKNNRVISLAESRKTDQIWLNTEKGEIFYISEGRATRLPASDKLDVSQIRISDQYTAINTYDKKLYSYNPSTSSYQIQPNWTELSNHPYENETFLLDEQLCYINGNENIRCYSLSTKTFTSHQQSETEKIIALGRVDSKQLVAMDADNSIYLFSPTAGLTKVFQLNDFSYKTEQIALDDNWIWLVSSEQGIVLVNRNNENIQIFTDANGLKNTTISSVVIDNKENLWLATNKGISSINPSNAKIRHFDSDYRLDDAQFMSRSLLKTFSGDIYFGSLSGIYGFTPEQALNSKIALKPPLLTKVYSANIPAIIKSELVEDKRFTINKHANLLEELNFEYNKFPLSIEFISPNTKFPAQTKYKYRLTGLDEKWIETDQKNRRATYTNLSAGEYTFEVSVYNEYQPEKTLTKSLKVNILPPWWQSKSALFLYGLVLFLFFIYVFQQMRHKRLYHLQIKASEERLKLSLWGSGDEMWDWNIITGKIFRSNIWGTLDFPQDGKRNVGTEHTNIHPYDIPRVKDALNAHFDQKTEHFESTYRVKSQTDQWMWVLDRGKIVERDEKGTPTRMTGTLKDISQIKKAEERLKLFAKCIENISDAVIIYDRQFVIVDVNKAYEQITGNQKKQVLGTTLKFNRYPDSFTQGVKKHLITNGSWRGEIESRRQDNIPYHTDLSIDVIRDESENISHFVGVFSDITSRKRNESELRKLANSDTLTGLPNRSFFQANQQHLVKNTIPHALLVFDLDNFKKINDSMGHQVGDLLLIEVAKRLITLSNKKITVYRLGGDEFSIIIEGTNDIHTITTVAKKILSVIAQPLKIKTQEVVLYSSIGIVLYPEDGNSPQELLKNADTAMYHAKDSGGNKYQFFSESMNKQAVKRLQVESLIRHGLKDDLFSVFYQPKIEISTGKIAGMEALVRFETPSKGVISPLVFIPVSEETGQIIDIGEIVLRKACFATKKWVDAGLFDGRIAVNLSAVQFTQPNLVAVITQILEDSGLAPKYLELEITEGTVMDSPQKAIDTMLQIRAMGIHLSLDDFGTGYSSLAYLKKFPLNTLKIDKAFVDDIEVSEQGRNMVATIVTIAHNLGLHVVAEGVETNNQLNFLSGLACEQLQGYLYSKPLAEPEFQKYLLSYQITNKSTSSIAKS